MYHKSGTHPLIQKYNATLDQANNLALQIEEAKRQAEQPSPRYGNTVVEVTLENTDTSVVHKVEGIRLTQTLLNQDAKEAYMEYWGSINGDWKESLHSVFYYRTEEGILTSSGGGYIILKREPIPITTTEWNEMKSGNIPKRLLK